jgi:hypothetical protein
MKTCFLLVAELLLAQLISPAQTPGVTISSDAPGNSLCSGTLVTFTATPVGTTGSNYQWKNNGVAVAGANSSTWSTTGLINGDAVTAELSVATGSIVSTGLVLHLDAGQSASYPGSGSTWTDISGNNNNVTIPEALASSYSYSIGGGSFNFQGNGSTTIQSNAMNNWNLTTTNALSVETWIKRTNYSNYQFWFSTPDLYYRLGVSPVGYLFWDMAHYVDRQAAVLVSEGVWHHVVYTAGIESGNITTRIYVDGALVTSLNEGVTALSPFTNYLIGDGQDPGHHPLNGNMGLIRVYNTALSASEVTQNYNAQIDRFSLDPLTSNTLTMTVRDLPSPTITASGPTTFCSGGSVTLSSTGNGNAIGFNGSGNYVRIPNMLSGATAFTIEYWMKTTQTGPGGSQWYYGNGIVDAEVAGVTNDFGTSLVGSKLCFGTGNPDISIQSVSSVNTGNWIHVAATWNAALHQMKLYINGTLETSTSASVSVNVKNAPPYIRFGSLQTNINYFNGQVDEVRFWNVERSQQQIQENSNVTVPSGSAGLVAYYKLDEGSGTTTADATVNGYTGTLINVPARIIPTTAPLCYTSYSWSTGSTVSSIAVTTSGTYVVTVTDYIGCSNSTAGTSVTVNPPSFIPGEFHISDLQATGSNIRWYSASTGGTLYTGADPVVNGNHYYASQTVNGVESADRLDVVANLDPTPCAPAASSPQAPGAGATVANLTTLVGQNIRWYLAGSGGAPLSPSTLLLSGTNTYYATQTVNCTESAARTAVVVNIP